MNSDKKTMLTAYVILSIIFLIGSASLIFAALYPYHGSDYIQLIKKILFVINIALPIIGIFVMIWLFIKRNRISANTK